LTPIGGRGIDGGEIRVAIGKPDLPASVEATSQALSRLRMSGPSLLGFEPRRSCFALVDRRWAGGCDDSILCRNARDGKIECGLLLESSMGQWQGLQAAWSDVFPLKLRVAQVYSIVAAVTGTR